MRLNDIVECLGMVIAKPVKAFEKIKENQSFLPGTVLLVFFSIFSVVYGYFTLNESLGMVLDDLLPDQIVILEGIFHSHFFKLMGLLVPLMVHFFQTAFYLLWFQLFGHHTQGVYLWNALAFCQLPSFIAQILILLLLLFSSFLSLSLLFNFFSFVAALWSLYLFLTALSVLFGIRKLKALGILLLPWAIMLVFLIFTMVWVFAGLAEADWFKEIINQEYSIGMVLLAL